MALLKLKSGTMFLCFRIFPRGLTPQNIEPRRHRNLLKPTLETVYGCDRITFPKKIINLLIFQSQVFHHSKASQEGKKFGFSGSTENKISEFQPKVSQNLTFLTILHLQNRTNRPLMLEYRSKVCVSGACHGRRTSVLNSLRFMYRLPVYNFPDFDIYIS